MKKLCLLHLRFSLIAVVTLLMWSGSASAIQRFALSAETSAPGTIVTGFIDWTDSGSGVISDLMSVDGQKITATLGMSDVANSIRLTNFGLNVPGNATIQNVSVRIEGDPVTGSPVSPVFRVVAAHLPTGAFTGTEYTPTTGVYPIAGAITGVMQIEDYEWAASQISSPDFYLEFWALDTGSGSGTYTIDSISLEVEYSMGAPSEVIGVGVDHALAVPETTGSTYQWWKDGVEISGATDAILFLGSTSVADSGTYSCQISGGEIGMGLGVNWVHYHLVVSNLISTKQVMPAPSLQRNQALIITMLVIMVVLYVGVSRRSRQRS